MGRASRPVTKSINVLVGVSQWEALPGLKTGQDEGARVIHPGEEAAEGDLIAVYHYPEGSYRQDGARLFSEKHRESARANSHGLPQGKFRVGLDITRGPFPSKPFCNPLFFFFSFWLV